MMRSASKTVCINLHNSRSEWPLDGVCLPSICEWHFHFHNCISYSSRTSSTISTVLRYLRLVLSHHFAMVFEECSRARDAHNMKSEAIFTSLFDWRLWLRFYVDFFFLCLVFFSLRCAVVQRTAILSTIPLVPQNWNIIIRRQANIQAPWSLIGCIYIYFWCRSQPMVILPYRNCRLYRRPRIMEKRLYAQLAWMVNRDRVVTFTRTHGDWMWNVSGAYYLTCAYYYY